MTKLTKLVTVVAGVAAVSCTAVSSLCAALSCDEFCEVSMTPSGVSVAHCACDVGYTRVRVTGSQRCNSQYLDSVCSFLTSHVLADALVRFATFLPGAESQKI